ncbi:PEP-CTERM sorting domain-containing protein [Piscinibacter sp. XHJ-5]|uniref:PEP-CTERM sorting domain-containing protein n=1 Tax=Piscinibacter sp. XHJ-5 TaxID=3037797 RepID=UPI0024530343|nr:PEP-CTERM sorting domain-containing protein [Piscinibacter sp. XHJ-5]
MKKKCALVASALALAAGASSAQLVFAPTGEVTFTQLFNPDGGVLAAGSYTAGQLGTFAFDAHGRFSLTYLGQESAYSNRIELPGNAGGLTEANAVGDSITSGAFNAGTPASFRFVGSDGGSAGNGRPAIGHATFVVLGTDVQTTKGSFQYLLGYNDGRNHDDWDDFVIGLNAMPAPEPQTYALLLAGLGMVGFIGWRNRRNR